MTGKVSNVPPDKKFGFISGGDGQEYFFHESDVVENGFNELATKFRKEGGGKVEVIFESTKTPKGPRAKNVSIFTP